MVLVVTLSALSKVNPSLAFTPCCPIPKLKPAVKSLPTTSVTELDETVCLPAVGDETWVLVYVCITVYGFSPKP